MKLLTSLGEWRGDEYYVEGLKYEFPKQPPLKSMKNYGLKKINQVWNRYTEYEQYDWSDGWDDRIKLPENSEQLNYIVNEIERISNGIWIIIGGEPQYFNGDMYFFLQWFMLHDTGEYPEFRDSSLYYYRFLEIVEKTKTCAGDVLIKNRRLGATSMRMSRLLRKAIMSRNKNFGITSKTGPDANDAFDMLVNAFQNLPVFLKPEMEGNDAPKKILSIKEQSKRITKDTKVSSGRKGLNNRVLWRATALNTFDSGAYEEIIVDESGKFPPDVPIDKYIPIVMKCVRKGARITGKLGLPTTVNPPKKGGSNFKRIWDSSNQLEADYLGQTPSGLYRIMIPAYYGFDGYIGRYGESIIENPTPEQTEYLKSTGICPDPNIGAKQYQELRRNALKHNEEDLQEEIRMNPWTAKEVFDTSGGKSYFDKKSHEEQLDNVKEKIISLGRDPDKDENGRRGKFVENLDGSVRFIDDEYGLWYILQFPKEPNLFDKKETSSKGVRYTPKNTAYGGAGMDPFAHASATVDKGSDACVIIRRRYNVLEPDESGMPVAMFLGRTQSKSEFHKQVFYALKYYGVKMLGERAPSDWVDWATENGYSDYLLGTTRSDGSEVKGISPQDKEAREEHLTEMVESSYNDVHKIQFKRLLEDRLAFEFDNRTDYDACIADGYSLIALKAPYHVKKKESRKISFVKKYKITPNY